MRNWVIIYGGLHTEFGNRCNSRYKISDEVEFRKTIASWNLPMFEIEIIEKKKLYIN